MKAQKRSEVKLLRAAEEDLREVIEYIAREHPASAERLLSSFARTFDALSKYPELGKLPDDTTLLALVYRYLITGKYLLFYKLEPDVVLIYRILSAARDYLSILQGKQIE
ncbi:MAG: type II toxin-antitoxin system RelE/ParE family toxin [Bacteroidota bacterium]